MGIDAQMFVRTMQPLTKEAVSVLCVQLLEEFDALHFWIRDGGGPLELRLVFLQDGPPIRPKPGETFVEVHLVCRYFGLGYPRGPMPLIAAVAEWLEKNIPGGEVWYGGDSSGALAEPLTKELREELLAYHAEEGCNRSYDEKYPRRDKP